MSQVSVGAAGLAGLKLLSRQPLLILIWAVVLLVAVILQGVLFMVLAGGAFMSLAATPELAADPAAMSRLMAGLIVPYLILILTGLLLNAVFVTGVNRAILRPEEGGVGYLRLGRDEVRQFVLMLAIGIPMFILYLVVAAPSIALGVLAGPAGPPLSLLLIVGLMSVPLVRFSLAGPQTFQEKAIRIFGSWTLTKGKFWPLLGAYLLACLMVFVIVLAFVALLAVVAGGSLNAETMQQLQTDPASASAMMGVFAMLGLLYLLLAPVIGAVSTAVAIAPPAAIYKQIAQPGPEAVF